MSESHMRKAFLPIGAVILAILLIVLLRHRPTAEPEYNRVRLSALVLRGVRDRTADDESLTTQLRALDTNALPYLVAWLSYEPPAWRFHIARSVLQISRGHAAVALAGWIIGNEQHDLAVGSLRAFDVLGTNAAPAIPALVTLMNSPAPSAAFNALAALRVIGTNSLPWLTAAARDAHHPLRLEAINAIRDILSQPITPVTPGISNAVMEAIPDLFTNMPSQ